METKKIRTISFKALIFPIIIMGFGLSFILTNRISIDGKDNWIRTTGQITQKVPDTRSPYVMVLYYVETERYESRGNIYKSTYNVGDTVAIKYNPSNHSEFTMIADNSILIPFTIAGSIIIAIGAGMILFEVSRSISAKKQLLETNSQLNLNYVPNLMYEYVPLKAENNETYKFKRQIKDLNNYEVTNSKGEILFYTKRIKKGFSSNATYQLIDSSTKQTTVINIKKPILNSKSNKCTLSDIKVNNLSMEKYFEGRHLTYNVSTEGNTTKYTLSNNGSILGYIYEHSKESNNFDIETAKENIDDLSLFALCLTYR